MRESARVGVSGAGGVGLIDPTEDIATPAELSTALSGFIMG